jgi:hypothetical protein
MALVGNMIAEAFAGNPATVNYSMYCAAFSMLSLFYLVPASFNSDWAFHPIIMVVVDALNCVFFFCAAIALAAKLHCHSCGNHVRLSSSFVWSRRGCKLISAVLPDQQRNHQRRKQHVKALPYGSSDSGLPVVRLGWVHGLLYRLSVHVSVVYCQPPWSQW